MSPGDNRVREAGRIKVAHHAVERYMDRQPDGATFFEAELGIEAEVVDALRSGRVSRDKPAEFRLHGRPARQMPPGERFAWSASGRLGWVIRRVEGGTLVTTTMTRTVAEALA